MKQNIRCLLFFLFLMLMQAYSHPVYAIQGQLNYSLGQEPVTVIEQVITTDSAALKKCVEKSDQLAQSLKLQEEGNKNLVKSLSQCTTTASEKNRMITVLTVILGVTVVCAIGGLILFIAHLAKKNKQPSQEIH